MINLQSIFAKYFVYTTLQKKLAYAIVVFGLIVVYLACKEYILYKKEQDIINFVMYKDTHDMSKVNNNLLKLGFIDESISPIAIDGVKVNKLSYFRELIDVNNGKLHEINYKHPFYSAYFLAYMSSEGFHAENIKKPEELPTNSRRYFTLLKSYYGS